VRQEIHLGGSGGQGILLVGNMLAYGGLKAGLEISWIPSYGAERRGGISFCAVTLSDRRIACPVTDKPDIVLAMDDRAMRIHLSNLKTGGVLVLNGDLATQPVERNDVSVCRLPSNRIAAEAATSRCANMAALGAILRMAPVIELDVMRQTLADVLGGRKKAFIEPNLKAMELGFHRAENFGPVTRS
jgi:2-oxoglutarate ferredoxin oxidoreductase subunit gamma